MFVPSPVLAPRGMGTWSARKPCSSSSRLPPLVAMGTVNFIITPWMGNKPKFWICGQRGGSVSTPSSSWGVEDEAHGAIPPVRPLQAPWLFHCRCSKALLDLSGGLQDETA